MRKVAADHPLASHPARSPSGLIQAGRPHGVAMTTQDLAVLKAAYVQAARDAQAVGADGVELHAAHGYLMDQFLWAETNQRTDGYGGATLAARARYPAEVLAALRAATGPEFALSVRVSQFKEVDYGASIARDPKELAGLLKLLRAAGADLFNVSSRRWHRPEWPQSEHPDYSIAEWARALTDAPVMTTGSVGLDVEMFANLFDDEEPRESQLQRDLAALAGRIRAGRVDLVGVGRMHIANNDLVAKVRAQRFAEIALFNKRVHLAEMMAAIEEGEPGFVEESRKAVAAD
jgi:2,4-dienoyl-CoA reductase-like NADH-dependent reductase (Old Yellow Enzyme family)